MLLNRFREVEYWDSVARKAYRAYPFWVEPTGRYAYAIPSFEKAIKGRNWKPFDHASRVRHCFNFGPVSEEQIREFVIPEAPPFFFHTLSNAGTRVKLGTGYSYGQHASYRFGYNAAKRNSNWVLANHRNVRDSLPEPYRSLFDKALPYCHVWG